MKKYIISAVLVAAILTVVAAGMAIPGRVTAIEGKEINIDLPIFGGLLEAQADECLLQRSEDGIRIAADKAGEYNIGFSVMGLPIKNSTLCVTKPQKVIPGGNTIGIRIYLKGVLVVGISEFSDSGNVVSPVRDGGIRKGDIITHVNGGEVENTTDLGQRIADSGGESVRLTVERNGKILEKKVKPVFRADMREYKIGAWVKDSTSGIGTLTFTCDEGFAALGHGVSDADTGERLVVDEGSILGCTVTSVKKGEIGAPGEMRGVFKNNIKGDILVNAENGIYGTIQKSDSREEEIPIASCLQVHEGEAQIISNVIDGEPRRYSAKIIKVMPLGKNRSKGMVIQITDEKLLKETGGIVQGMSGSPIIQDGVLAGAVTHVFVNNPSKGYGVFAEWMMESLRNIKSNNMY